MLEILNSLRGEIHLLLHVIFPLAIAYGFFRIQWKKAFAIMIATMVVDIDHLLAEPIYQADRCSIGFHPLHTTIPIILYIVMCCHPKTRLVGIGLTLHMLLDASDCVWMTYS